MSEALDKNTTAVAALTDARSAQDTITSCKIGVWSQGNKRISGTLLARSLGEILGRFWYNIDSGGPYAGIVTDSALRASRSCRFGSIIRDRWEPPYDFVIRIGCCDVLSKDGVSVGADGWRVNSGHNAALSDDPNPAGPFFAAVLASAEAFKSAFAGSQNRMRPLPSDHAWNSWYGEAACPATADIDLGEIHVFGVGAVTHGMFWILRDWPGRISGKVHLIDPDKYDYSNAQRYLGMRSSHHEVQKVERAADGLLKAHPGLEVIPHSTGMNEYFETENPGYSVRLAVCGLDSEEGRRQLALKLPRRVVNMWTSGFHAGASRFGFGSGWPCVYCAYPAPSNEKPDEASDIHRKLGLQPVRTRQLLDSGLTLDGNDVAVIAAHTGMRQESLAGKTLRSVMGDICALDQVVTPQGAKLNAVLAPVSGFAGAAGFVELVRETTGRGAVPGHLQTSILAYPNANSWQPRAAKPDCTLCSDPLVLERIREKYEKPQDLGSAYPA